MCACLDHITHKKCNQLSSIVSKVKTRDMNSLLFIIRGKNIAIHAKNMFKIIFLFLPYLAEFTISNLALLDCLDC